MDSCRYNGIDPGRVRGCPRVTIPDSLAGLATASKMACDLSPQFASHARMWLLRHRFRKNRPECIRFVDAINDLPNIQPFLWGWIAVVRYCVWGSEHPIRRREAGRSRRRKTRGTGISGAGPRERLSSARSLEGIAGFRSS